LVVRLQSKQCPAAPYEIAEAYVMGTLPNEQAVAFEDHYVVCNSCATVLENASTYVEAIRTAAKILRPEPVRAASGSSAY
jgi:formylmethanofuran:tetrahydromethanopterin formyltransferase